MKPRILVSSYYSRQITDPLLARLDDVAEIVRPNSVGRLSRASLIALIRDVEVAVISDEQIDASILCQAPSLRMICTDGVGVDTIDLEAATHAGVLVNNAPCVHECNGDFTLGLILAVMRRIVVGDRAIRQGDWHDRAAFVGESLRGRTLGLLGFGRVARAVARRAAAFDMRLMAYSRHPDREAARRLGVDLVDFDRLLSEADVLSIHVTLTEQTEGMVGAEQLRRMKRGSYLINTSRGPVVEHGALLEALRSHHLTAAALDVFDSEPPDINDALFKLDNVVATPHIASDTRQAFEAVFTSVVNDVLQYLLGRRPGHIVNANALQHPIFSRKQFTSVGNA